MDISAESSAARAVKTPGGTGIGRRSVMDEIDYQLSLQILDWLIRQGLISLGEQAAIVQELKAHYQPKVILLTG